MRMSGGVPIDRLLEAVPCDFVRRAALLRCAPVDDRARSAGPAGSGDQHLPGRDEPDRPGNPGNYRYETTTVQPRAWDDKMYFLPIQRDELNRNSALRQNPGH
jgi:hypothetical protein